MKKFWKIFGKTMLVQIVIWIIFNALDFAEENDIGGESVVYLLFLSILIIPVVISILYMIFDRKETEKTKKFVMTSIIWIIETSIIGVYICDLVNYNKWIILQDRSDFLSFNGFEYFLFSCSCAILPIVIVLVCRGINYIYKKITN